MSHGSRTAWGTQEKTATLKNVIDPKLPYFKRLRKKEADVLERCLLFAAGSAFSAPFIGEVGDRPTIETPGSKSETHLMHAANALHPTDQTLHAYGLGKLDHVSAESVSQHVESCSDCQHRVAELSSDSFLGRLRDAQGRPDSPAPIMSATDGLSMLVAGPGAPAPPSASTLPPGLADHPDYEITRELGRGGMGVVYLAQNRLMGRLEVLKVVVGHLVNRRGVLDRFLAEIRNAARLEHPNVVTAYSALRMGESLVLAMQYVEGLDLAKMVKARGPLPVAQACNYVQQAALGLQHAHEHGMVHRDIKPGNLMLTRQGNRALIKVLDFGLAKLQSEGTVDGGLTHEGQMLGTPDYIAPEQISDARRADIRADIYSLGCTLYYLLTGGPPFQGTSLYDILQAHHSMDAKPLNLARPEVPVELAALVAKMMAKEPERRFQEPKEVAQALTPFFKKGSGASVGSTPEFSQAGRPDARQATATAGSVPTRPTAASGQAPALSVRKPVGPAPPDVLWESLVDLNETEAAPATAANRRPPWLWPATAAATLLLGLIVAWGAATFKLKTPEGFIVLQDLPDQTTVLVDGRKATVHWPDGGGSAEITVAPGDHEVQVKKDGFTTFGQKVTLESGGRKMLTARLEPLEAPPAQKGDVDDGPGRPVAAKPPVRPAAGAVVTTSPTPPTIATANPTTKPTEIAGSQAGKVDAVNPDATGPAQDQVKDAARLPNRKTNVLSGAWRVEGKELVQTGGEGTILLGDTPLSSFDMKFQGQVVSGEEGFVALFHRTSGDNVRFFHVGESRGTEVNSGLLCEGKEGGQSKPIAIVKGRWYNVLVKVRGAEFWCYLDGQELFHDVDERFVRGRIGLATWDANARYRDIVVKTPDGKVVWNGLPDLPGRKAGEPSAPDSAAKGPARPQTRDAARSPRRTAQVASGKWRVEGNELIKTDANEPGEIRFGDPSWSRYDLTFKVIGIEGLAAFNTKFHYKSSRDQCLLEIGDDRVKNITYFYYLHKEKASELLDRRYPIELGRAYDVRLIVRGPVVTTYLDGKEWFDNVDVPLTEGRIGFATAGTSARYREIAITSPEGKPLWIGPPNRLVDGEGKVLWEAPTN
jgi:serine/threonine protein kinase